MQSQLSPNNDVPHPRSYRSRPPEGEEPIAVTDDRKLNMTVRTLLAIVGGVAVSAAAYANLQGQLSSLKESSALAAARTSAIEGQQRIEHDVILRLDAKIDFLVGGRKGNPPPAGQPN